MWLSLLSCKTEILFLGGGSVQVLFHVPIDGHLGCFCLSAIVNNAAMNRGIQASPQDPAFSSFGYVPTSGIFGSQGNYMSNILKNHHTVSHIGYTNSIYS